MKHMSMNRVFTRRMLALPPDSEAPGMRQTAASPSRSQDSDGKGSEGND